MSTPFLALNGVTIPVARRELLPQVEEFGDRARAADGTDLSRIDARKLNVPLRTRWMSASDFALVYATMTAAPPLMATGRMLGAMSVSVEILGRPIYEAGGHVVHAVEFTLRQS